MLKLTAGDYFQAMQTLGDDRAAEVALFVQWRSRQRQGQTTDTYEDWLDTVDLMEVQTMVDEVNAIFDGDRSDNDPT